MISEKLKILLIDFETSPNIGYSFGGKHEVEILDFVEEGRIISMAYKWLGQKRVKCITLAEYGFNHKKFVGEIHKVFNEADAILAHNGDNFDIKMANREFVKEGYLPPKPYKQIDTLKNARRHFKFTSNRLDDLGDFLGVGRKVKIEKGVWLDCVNKNINSYKKLARYNKGDVVLLENVYLKLRAWQTSHPTIPQLEDEKCPICGGDNCVSQGKKQMKRYWKKNYQCRDCGSWHCGDKKYQYDNKRTS